ncbi:MAG: DNA polymerase III subunit delta' [Bacteroidales bacterium]|nr:DNA polymerase III subunit delta' [Bacteroidales bacterium]
MLFSEVIGHEELKRRLIQSVRESRVSHAQLFLGPEGSGKLPIALAYAQYINCTNRSETDSCGVCPSCRKFMSLTHPDLHFVFPTATNKGVKQNPESDLFISEWREYLADCQCYADLSDWFNKLDIENKQGVINVRDAVTILRKLSFKAYESEYKIAIIWMADKLNVQCANKLLKLIEEPPEKTLFILIAENQEELLTTIRSRCMLVKVPKITMSEVQDALVQKFACSTQEAYDAAALADGNWLLAQHFVKDKEDEKLYANVFQKWMRYCFKGAVPELIDLVANDIKPLGREKQKEFLEYGLNIFHNSLLFNNNMHDDVLLPTDEKNFTKNFAPFINMRNVEQICSLFEESINQIERNGNASIIFADNSFKITKLLRVK